MMAKKNLYWIHEDLEKDPFAISIKGQLNNWN
jgi:hypothetical protein